jgi:hypothetical protein
MGGDHLENIGVGVGGRIMLKLGSKKWDGNR